MKQFKITALALIAIVTFSSCSDDDSVAPPVNEEEVITTVTVTFTPTDGGTTITLTSRDLDGDGPNAPVVTVSGNLMTGTTYDGRITFVNELANPIEDITEEINAEGDEHQIFYQQTGLGDFTYLDDDANGNPIGLHFIYTAPGITGNGSLTVTLRHEPNKDAEGVVQGIITNAGGATDAEVTFNVVIE